MRLRTRIGLKLVGDDFWAFESRRSRRLSDLEDEIEKMELQQARSARDLLLRFIEGLELVDEDEMDPYVLRNGLRLGLEDLKDHVARLEEHR